MTSAQRSSSSWFVRPYSVHHFERPSSGNSGNNLFIVVKELELPENVGAVVLLGFLDF